MLHANTKGVSRLYDTYHVVGLIYAQQEDELGEEKRRHQVPVDGVEVGAESPQDTQQDEREEEEEQGDGHRGVGDDLQGENVAVLGKDATGEVRKRKWWIGNSQGAPPLFFFGKYLSLRDIHEHRKAGHVVALTADVAVVPVEDLAAFGGPATRTSDPEHI